jgi:hypothetical protein
LEEREVFFQSYFVLTILYKLSQTKFLISTSNYADTILILKFFLGVISMRIKIVLMAVFCMILGVAAVSAQDKTTNFAGNWELDAGKSKLSDMMRIESMTMNVAQTDKDLTIETKTKRAERPEGEMRGGNGGGNGGGRRGGGRMGRGMGGDGTFNYTLDGKETSATSGDAKLKAKFEKDGKLKLMQTRNLETPMGAVSIKTNETWELKDDDKTLIVKRDTETPRGTQSSEMYFTKK